MKVAITSTGNTLESNVDQRFGRCAYFVIYDSESKSVEYIPNPNKQISEGAGPASVQILAERGVHKIVSGDFGLKVKPLLDSLKVQMIVIKHTPKTVSDIIESLEH
ncbi:MAG TPA: NifB/NifX family molybdenum-iron cluster-binding protein [Bacteroidales bacterium]|jgi:predicted Fe-Mo cluster-binding NifX family protein|nr:dinitrogenase iron-molybdenum cofactor biosynthesis protein [Bacteroidales bacterium]HOS16380.1 NifB/NifX family molybdenum-iron cluster-binding protein [Bacteroidales bacterium]